MPRGDKDAYTDKQKRKAEVLTLLGGDTTAG